MKLRSFFLFLGIFAIGFVLGILSAAQVRNKKMKDFRSFATPEAFRQRFEKMLEPSPEQMEKILPLLDRYGKLNLELRKKYGKEFYDLMKLYRQELEPLLTPGQLEELRHRSLIRAEQDRKYKPDSLRREHHRGTFGPSDSIPADSIKAEGRGRGRGGYRPEHFCPFP